MTLWHMGILTILGLMTATAASAGISPVALGVRASTLGSGVESTIKLNRSLDTRLGANAFRFNIDGTQTDIDYDVDVKLLTVSGLLDWYPWQGHFRVSGGAMLNRNRADAKADSANSYTVGGTTYTLADIGTLEADVDFNDVAPYIGIGWGRPFTARGDWSINLDLGVMYQGEASVGVTTTGLLNSPALAADIEEERAELEDAFSDYQWYPVVALGLVYRF